ncbi:type I polyketide synthase [Streptomyces boninensis]|uniref:type I polyketide synthase n=1 Tax=Streptomyces boninensis TaxID=2039455 RepID=UPI003B21448E
MSDLAVVGLDCAFAGADGPDAYWDLLMRGADAIGPLPAHRRHGPEFDGLVQGAFLEHADVFDHAFFSVSPREAGAMDPQHRLLLHSAWRALEDSGRAPGGYAGSDTGVFVGTMSSEWAQLHLGDYDRITPQLGSGSAGGMAANRISYHLDLKGPSLAVDSACSSSLVAVHLAGNALLSGECGTALAAGVNLVLTPALGLVYQQMGLASPSGRCKPFSADADGIVRSDGVGVVVLRRLEDALADGQRVYAVIKGTAVNQDGRSNGVTAPSRWSQKEVLAAAYRRAGVGPEQIRFIEAHGTGTVLGDTIECAALGEVHAVRRDQPCAIGSVKGNLGHTEGAAGIAGLIKVALALHHRIVPASRFATRENPRLRLGERGLRLLKAPVRLPAAGTLGAVSSFGMGGTNAHAVLATAPRIRRAPARRTPAAGGVFTLSADTPQALRRNLAAQAEAVARRPRGDAASLCWSSNRVKTGLPYRAAFPVGDTGELVAALRAAAEGEPMEGAARAAVGRAWREPVVAFLFTGDDAPEPGLLTGLYEASPAYRRYLDAADAAQARHSGSPLGTDPAAAGRTLPAVFAVQYALYRTLGELGVHPQAVLGHGAGEYAAAVAAGVLGLEDAARLVVARDGCTDAGFARIAGELTYERPEVPYVSSCSGRVLANEPVAAGYFIAQATEPVRWADACAALTRDLEPTALVEVGPRPSLPAGARTEDARDIPLVHPASGRGGAVRELAEALAELYRSGVEPRWDGLYSGEQRRPERLEPYAFATEHRFWRQPARREQPATGQPPADAAMTQPPSADPAPAAGDQGDSDPVFQAIVQAVAEVGGHDGGLVGRATRFHDDLGFDSVMIMQLKDRIESRLPQAGQITVQQLLPELHTVGTLAAFLSEWISIGAAT